MTLKDLPPTISVERAGELLGISRRSAYRAASNGDLTAIRIGRRLLVPTGRLLELLGVPSGAQDIDVRAGQHKVASSDVG